MCKVQRIHVATCVCIKYIGHDEDKPCHEYHYNTVKYKRRKLSHPSSRAQYRSKMCHQYSKLPTEEVEREEKREKTSNKTKTEKQTKWKRVKKVVTKVGGMCVTFISGITYTNVSAMPTSLSAGCVWCDDPLCLPLHTPLNLWPLRNNVHAPLHSYLLTPRLRHTFCLLTVFPVLVTYIHEWCLIQVMFFTTCNQHWGVFLCQLLYFHE